MKRVLSILLAMSLVLSLCACSGGDKGKGDVSSNQSGQVDAATISDNAGGIDSTPDESEAPKRVTGDRVPLNGEDGGPKYMPTGWAPGPIDPEDLFMTGRLPIDENNFKLTVSGEMDGGGILKMMIAVKDGNTAFEMETSKDAVSLTTRFFEQDGDVYMYVKGLEEGIAEKLYRLVEPEQEPAVDDEGNPIESEPVEGDPVEDDNSYEGGVSSITDAIGMDDIAGGIDSEGMSPDNYKSVEYVDLIGGNDTFRAITKKDEEQLILVDHTTGWIVGVNQVSGGTDDLSKMAIRIDYEVKDDITYDVSGAEDINADEAMMTLFAQIFMLVDFGDMTMSED